MMQIFVINFEGKSVTIEVESDDLVKTVKEKIEAKEGIPVLYQGLNFNGTRLMDDKSLLHYNVQKESNLRIVWQRPEHHEAAVEPSVDWTKLANTAKDKIDQEVEVKKALYADFLEKKLEAVEGAKNIKSSMKSGEINIRMLNEKLLEEEKEVMGQRKQILWMELELKRMRLVLELATDRKRELEKGLNDEQEEMDCKKQKLYSFEDKLIKVHREMKETLLLAGEGFAQKNADLARENQKHKLALKEFLNQSISTKEDLLECPVCYRTASPPIYKCPMEHLICSGCLPRVNGRCPTCRTQVFYQIFRIAEEIWGELQKLKKSVMDIQEEENEKLRELRKNKETTTSDYSFCFNPFDSDTEVREKGILSNPLAREVIDESEEEILSDVSDRVVESEDDTEEEILSNQSDRVVVDTEESDDETVAGIL
eukprot:GFUD01036971.1.p1 GENE.GFUD01036971.1~~GFUD01036971.1.p1  ORF type:complete len:426 (+),score=117.27 GFUD01036971.1:76-1353(+)